MSAISRLTGVLLLPIAVAGCAAGWFHVGNEFDLDAFSSRVERGVTTRDQVRSWLGAPVSVGVDVDTSGQRFDKWSYYFGEGRVSDPGDTKLKTLQIKFDAKGVVQGWETSKPAS